MSIAKAGLDFIFGCLASTVVVKGSEVGHLQCPVGTGFSLDCRRLLPRLTQGQARGYGHITSFACRPHGANTSNLYM